MDFDVVIESLRALVTALILLYLWQAGKREQIRQQKGWGLITGGFSLILFATLLDISDNFSSLNPYVVIGDTPAEAFLEKIVGYLGGFVVLFIGFTQWFPLVSRLRSTEAELRNKTAELEMKVADRTADLLKKNEELEKETKLLAAAEERIRQLAYYDPLTRLPNRYLLSDRLAQIIAASKRSSYYCALVFLDLDNFKQLNDTQGHNMGDLLLMEVAHRITGSVREVDTVARLGGDEFVVVLNKLDMDAARSAAQASIIAERVRVAIEMPYVLVLQQQGKADVTVQHRCTSSIGVVLFVADECSQEEILKRADMAMYQSKEAGRNQVRFYDPGAGSSAWQAMQARSLV